MTRALIAARLDRAPRWVVAVLDSRWLWHGIAYAGLAVVSVLLWANYKEVAHTQARQAREDAAKAAQIVAAHERTRVGAAAAYARCVSSRPLLIRLDRFIDGVKETTSILVVNAKALLALPAQADRRTKEENLKRLALAVANVQEAPRLVVPTMGECAAARDRALVDGGLPPRRRR